MRHETAFQKWPQICKSLFLSYESEKEFSFFSFDVSLKQGWCWQAMKLLGAEVFIIVESFEKKVKLF